MTHITEGMNVELCVLAKVDEKRVWKCLESGKGQESREGPELHPRLDNCWGLQLTFMSPTEISLWEGRPGVKGQGWRVHWSGLRKQ